MKTEFIFYDEAGDYETVINEHQKRNPGKRVNVVVIPKSLAFLCRSKSAKVMPKCKQKTSQTQYQLDFAS